MKRWAALLALILTACWPGRPMGKEWTSDTLMAYATAQVTSTTPATQIPCREAALDGLQACFAVNGPVGSVRTPLDEAFGKELHLLGDWQFVGGGGAATYQTRAGEKLNLGLVYGANDGYTMIMEDLPKGTQGVLHVFVESAPFQ